MDIAMNIRFPEIYPKILWETFYLHSIYFMILYRQFYRYFSTYFLFSVEFVCLVRS